MPKKKLTQWALYRLKGSPAAFIAIVYAPDEKAALKAAIKEFAITPGLHLLRGRAGAEVSGEATHQR